MMAMLALCLIPSAIIARLVHAQVGCPWWVTLVVWILVGSALGRVLDRIWKRRGWPPYRKDGTLPGHP